MYKHKVNTNDIKKVNILGVNIAAIDMSKLVEFTNNNIKKLSGDYICVSNVHTTVTAYKNPDYLKVQNNAILAIPDGGPLASEGRKRGYDISRTVGQDYMKELLKNDKYKHFFYGSTKETLDGMEKELLSKYPNLQIVGKYSPPFRELSIQEDNEIVSMINNAKPDFVWVGLGAPKQEIWMYNHQGKIKGLMVGVGAAFDYFAGNIKRAPRWMQKANLEWLYRLIQNPKKLFKRYLYTNVSFIWNAMIKGR